MIAGIPPGTHRASSPPVKPPPANHEAQLAHVRKACAFSGKPLPTESDCKPIFRYLNGQCPFDDPHLPDAAAGKAMLDYCMKTYGSLGPLWQVMSDYPFTVKVKLLDYADLSAAVLSELAKWNIPCDVEAVIGGNEPDAEKDLAGFLSHEWCNVRTLTVHCRKLDEEKVKPLGEALAACPSLKNFELVAVTASVVVAILLDAVTKTTLESLTVVEISRSRQK